MRYLIKFVNCNFLNEYISFTYFRDGCHDSGVFVAGCVVKEMQEVTESVSIAEAVQLVRTTRPQFITDKVIMSELHDHSSSQIR